MAANKNDESPWEDTSWASVLSFNAVSLSHVHTLRQRLPLHRRSHCSPFSAKLKSSVYSVKLRVRDRRHSSNWIPLAQSRKSDVLDSPA